MAENDEVKDEAYWDKKQAEIRKTTAIAGGVFVVVIEMYLIITQWFFGVGTQKGGQFGDAFGGLTAFFSGLAFIAVVVAVLYQRLELEQTREEMKATTKALEDQKTALNNQLQELKNQTTLERERIADDRTLRLVEKLQSKEMKDNYQFIRANSPGNIRFTEGSHEVLVQLKNVSNLATLNTEENPMIDVGLFCKLLKQRLDDLFYLPGDLFDSVKKGTEMHRLYEMGMIEAVLGEALKAVIPPDQRPES